MSSITNEAPKNTSTFYTPLLLKAYNIWVIHLSNQLIWRCPSKHITALYTQHCREKHLDIGVGTGYHLQHATLPAQCKLSLMDDSPHSLNVCQRNLIRYQPVCYQADIYKPQTFLKGLFSSISACYLLHCLPGDMRQKHIALVNMIDMLKPGGILFGATIISDPKRHNSLSQKLMAFYNRHAIFSNQYDSQKALQHVLNENLKSVEINMIGCVALFSGRK